MMRINMPLYSIDQPMNPKNIRKSAAAALAAAADSEVLSIAPSALETSSGRANTAETNFGFRLWNKGQQEKGCNCGRPSRIR
jgi:hypothetical protein